MAPPNTSAAPSTTTASVSSARTGPDGLKPSIRTTAVSPAQSATTAAKAMRRDATTTAPSALGLHRAGDHEALDLVRALVDLGDLRVAHHPLDGILGDVAVPTQDLHGLDGHRHRGVGCEQLGHGAVLPRLRVAPIGERARLVEQLP